MLECMIGKLDGTGASKISKAYDVTKSWKLTAAVPTLFATQGQIFNGDAEIMAPECRDGNCRSGNRESR